MDGMRHFLTSEWEGGAPQHAWASGAAIVLASLFARYVLGLFLRAAFQRTRPPVVLNPALPQIYSARAKQHLALPDPNESIDLAKQLGLGIEDVNAWFRAKSQFERETVRTRRALESLWSLAVYALIAFPATPFLLRLALYASLIAVHCMQYTSVPRWEFFQVLGELSARMFFISILTTQQPSLANVFCLTHDGVDAFFELTKLASLIKLHQTSRAMFVLFALAWLGLKLVYFPAEVVQLVENPLQTRMELAGFVFVLAFDLVGAVTVLQTLRDAFWTENASGIGRQQQRRDSDLSSAGYSEYDSDSSISSNLKHY